MRARYVRYESEAPNRRGAHPGLFALLKGVREQPGLAAPEKEHAEGLVRRSYDLHIEPPAACFDPVAHPGARSWFLFDSGATRAAELRQLVAEVLAVLDRHRVRWRVVTSDDPGRLTYEDDVQVVAVPHQPGS